MRAAAERLADLVRQLLSTQRECEWVEYKHNNADPREIGEYISALSNAAALHKEESGYVVWGVQDGDRMPVGTTFDPVAARIGAEELTPWLTKLLSPQPQFTFDTLWLDSHRLVVLRIAAAVRVPVQFKGTSFIRIGSYKKQLAKHREHERRLWLALEASSFESRVAVEDLDVSAALGLVDYTSYFSMLDTEVPDSRARIVERLEADALLQREATGRWGLTGLGALLFAKDLHRIPAVSRKTVRVVVYRGSSRVESVREHDVSVGYAAGFQSLVRLILDNVPTNEVIESALRQTVPMYPPVAIRELVANALIHQDFTITGTGPMVEVFPDRVEITNPGQPVVEPQRFLDLPPRSRNEGVASLMRRLGVCEERGSGWDKVAVAIEFHQLPAPRIEVTEQHTRVTLLGHRSLTKMERDDRVRAVYMHACLRYVMHERLTNSSVRERFGIGDRSSAQASRLIAEAVEDKLVVPYDSEAGKRYMSYVPYWASMHVPI